MNVVEVREVLLTQRHLCLVMELAGGGTLTHHVIDRHTRRQATVQQPPFCSEPAGLRGRALLTHSSRAFLWQLLTCCSFVSAAKPSAPQGSARTKPAISSGYFVFDRLVKPHHFVLRPTVCCPLPYLGKGRSGDFGDSTADIASLALQQFIDAVAFCHVNNVAHRCSITWLPPSSICLQMALLLAMKLPFITSLSNLQRPKAGQHAAGRLPATTCQVVW